MFMNCLWFNEQEWETVFKPFTMKICEVIWIFTNYLWKTGSWKREVYFFAKFGRMCIQYQYVIQLHATYYISSRLSPPLLCVQTEKRERNEEQDDIESNLLVPAGVTLRLVTLNLKVYRAEDMPQSTCIFLLSPSSTLLPPSAEKYNLVQSKNSPFPYPKTSCFFHLPLSPYPLPHWVCIFLGKGNV